MAQSVIEKRVLLFYGVGLGLFRPGRPYDALLITLGVWALQYGDGRPRGLKPTGSDRWNGCGARLTYMQRQPMTRR